MPSIENVLQDGSPEPRGRGQSSAPADIYLPGNSAQRMGLLGLGRGRAVPLELALFCLLLLLPETPRT